MEKFVFLGFVISGKGIEVDEDKVKDQGVANA